MDARARWQSNPDRRFRRQPVRPRGDLLPAAHVLASRPVTLETSRHPEDSTGGLPAGHVRPDETAIALVDLALASLDAVVRAGAQVTSPPLLLAELLGAASHRHPIDCAAHYRRLSSEGRSSGEIDALDEAWQVGRGASPVAAAAAAARVLVDTALQLAASQLNPGPSIDELTRRECEVLSLIAHGLTDREIAQRLGISRHTATTHVKRVRAKLGGGSRAAVALHAVLGGQSPNVSRHSVYSQETDGSIY